MEEIENNPGQEPGNFSTGQINWHGMKIKAEIIIIITF